MKIEELLNQFYLNNGLPLNGGVSKNTFNFKLGIFNIPVPNPKFRKDVVHIHDIEHILNNCDTSHKGEAFIAGWEVGTRFYKYFPINIFIFLAFGYSLLMYPKTVFKGFKKGLNNIGIIDLGLSKTELMQMERNQLVKITQRQDRAKLGFTQLSELIFCTIISQIFLFSPIILLMIALIFL